MKPTGPEWLTAAGAYLCFYSMKRLGVFLLPLDGMLSSPSQVDTPRNSLYIPIYTPGWREALRELLGKLWQAVCSKI